jgi:ketosteroid isomerase-like protein
MRQANRAGRPPADIVRSSRQRNLTENSFIRGASLRDTSQAMSPENVDLWRASIEVFLAGTSELDRERTLTKMAELWDPEIEWDVSAFEGPDIGGVYRGIEAVRQFWQEWLAAWETLLFEYELVDAGDRVVMLLDQRMRGRSTGIEVSLGRYAQVATFRDGLMVHWKVYMSQSEALETVGLSAQDANAHS